MSNSFVAIIMGSDSDLPLLENTMAVLKEFDIKYEARVASAHRTPDVVSEYDISQPLLTALLILILRENNNIHFCHP